MKILSKIAELRIVVLFLICLSPVYAVAGLINGGFEDDFTAWMTTGNTAVVTVVNISDLYDTFEFTPFAGEKMAALTYPMTGFVWENTISQDITLTADDHYLNFYYNFWTLDESPFDSPGFMVEINGKTIMSISAGDIGDGSLDTLNFTGWKPYSIDLSGYYSPDRQAFIRISFAAGNTGDTLNPSGAFIDGMEVSADPIVPIPTTLLLMMSGLLGFVGLRRRRGV